MNQDIIFDITKNVYGSIGAGYSYVLDFAQMLNKYKDCFKIKNIFIHQKITLNDDSITSNIFCDNKKFKIDGLYLDDISSSEGVIDSHCCDFSRYNNGDFANLHIIAFPIHPSRTKEILMDMKGFVLIMSFPQIEIDNKDAVYLYDILNAQYPKATSCEFVKEAIRMLLATEINTKQISIKDRHFTFGKSLDFLAGKCTGLQQEHGLRHFSFWSTDCSSDGIICKEFNKNTFNQTKHTKTPKILKCDSSHFIASFSRKYKGTTITSYCQKIKLYNFFDIQGDIIDCEYFNNIGITSNDSCLIIVPVDFNTQISYCCFYIKDILFSPFVSISLFEELSNAIRLSINFVNETNIKNMLDKIMEASFRHKQSKLFFQEVSNILKESNEAEDCLIYLRNLQGDKLLLVTEEDENNNNTFKENNMSYNQYGFYLPRKYLTSNLIVDQLRKASQSTLSFFCHNEQEEGVNSICITKIYDADDVFCGFILLVNNKHITRNEGLFYNELFFFNNIYITQSCCNYLPLYLGFLHSNYSKTNLLKKLRHEIPQCTRVINKNMTEISAKVDDRGFRVNTFPKKAKELQINCKRINTIASFFSTINFDDEKFLENPSEFNMRDFVNETMEIFQEEAAYRGVCIRCNTEADSRTIMVSNYYGHAITNIIINAIRYAAPGTCIWIRSNYDEILVSDIGIPIHKNEMDKIFLEGYRSASARAVNGDGMGYGLYLTKRIIDAYQHKLEVFCEPVARRNYFAERAVGVCLHNINPELKNSFVYEYSLPDERDRLTKLLNGLEISEASIPHHCLEFVNNDRDSLDFWFSYQIDKCGQKLWSMEKDFFENELYKVTFKISL